MNKFRFTIHALAIAIFTLVFASMAQAQATRTWVSGVGDDANPCSRTAPCKTFAGAISKTFTGGEIDVLDSGGFGTINITKSITIDGGAGFGSILASGTFGAQVNVAAGNANDPQRRVTLRRLSINGTGASGSVGTSTGTRGINYISGLMLHVENCYIQNFTQEGINFSHTASGGFMSVKDTNIANCANGVNITTTTGFVTGAFDRVRLEKNTSNGMVIGTHGHAHVRDSFINFNGADGITMAASVTDGTVNVESSMLASNNTVGIRNGGTGSIVDISNVSMMQNGTAFATASGAAGGGINSHGNNSVNGTIGTTPNGIGQN